MNWLKILFTYLPIVLQGVVAVEGALQGAPGATKKQVILNAITAGATVGETAPDKTVAGVSALIDNVVGTLNQSGIFGHAVAPPANPLPTIHATPEGPAATPHTSA